jgi:hypothetical protein
MHIKPSSGNLILDVDTTNNHYAGGNQYTGDTSNTTQDIEFVMNSYKAGGRDYVASNGSVVFDASDSIDTAVNSSASINSNITTSANDDYIYNVAAIAKDNVQLLINTKSTAQGETTPLLTTEMETTGLLDDKEFMFVGSNNTATGSSSISTTELPVTGLPTATNSRIAREWRVQKKAVVAGNVVNDPAMGTFKLSFNLSALGITPTNVSGFRLVIDDNGDFTGGTQTVYPTSSEPTYDSATGSVVFTGVTLNNGQYFTLALPRTAPGGVTSGLRAWYRADQGTYVTAGTPSVDAGTVDVWKDQSGNGKI